MKIDKNIPIPTVRKKRGKWVEKFRKMNAGESIEVDDWKAARSIQGSLRQSDIKVTCRQDYDTGKVRVWKLES